MDTIAGLGELAFASRLRRLSERLGKDVSLLYRKLNVDFDARWFVVFYTLHHNSPMSISALADAAGLSHTAVMQLARKMIARNLISVSAGREDRREQLLRVTPHGKATARSLEPVWQEIRAATKELINESQRSFLTGLATLERRLDHRSMYERVWCRLKGSLPANVEIREYDASMKKHFRSLNYEWLEEYFVVEQADERQLSDPNKAIIKIGGTVLFACLDGEVVGTCAIIRHRSGVTELAKMAVTRRYRGRGIGAKLLEAVIERAHNQGVSALYLRTSPKLDVANRLYAAAGFRKTSEHPFSDGARYARKTFIMKLTLDGMDSYRMT